MIFFPISHNINNFQIIQCNNATQVIQNSCTQSDKGSTVLFIWHASCTKKILRLLSDLIRSRCIQRNKISYIYNTHEDTASTHIEKPDRLNGKSNIRQPYEIG